MGSQATGAANTGFGYWWGGVQTGGIKFRDHWWWAGQMTGRGGVKRSGIGGSGVRVWQGKGLGVRTLDFLPPACPLAVFFTAAVGRMNLR